MPLQRARLYSISTRFLNKEVSTVERFPIGVEDWSCVYGPLAHQIIKGGVRVPNLDFHESSLYQRLVKHQDVPPGRPSPRLFVSLGSLLLLPQNAEAVRILRGHWVTILVNNSVLWVRKAETGLTTICFMNINI